MTTLSGLTNLADYVNEEIVGEDRVVINVLARKAYRSRPNGIIDRDVAHTGVTGRMCRVHCPRKYTCKRHLPHLAQIQDAVFVTKQEQGTRRIYVAQLQDIDLLQ